MSDIKNLTKFINEQLSSSLSNYIFEMNDEKTKSMIKNTVINGLKDKFCKNEIKISERKLDWIEQVLGKEDKDIFECEIIINKPVDFFLVEYLVE